MLPVFPVVSLSSYSPGRRTKGPPPYDEKVTTGKRGSVSKASKQLIVTRTEAMVVSRFSGGDFLIIARPYRGWRFRCGTGVGFGRNLGVEIENAFLQKLGSGLVVQSSR